MKQPDLANTSSVYDFLFIGLGGANSLLILNLYKNGLLDGKTIAVIEPSRKLTDEKTFCFWSTKEELFTLNLEELVSHSWKQIEITGITTQSIQQLSYHHVKGPDLTNKTKEVLSLRDVTYFQSTLDHTPTIGSNYLEVTTGGSVLQCHKVFDSRPPTFSKLEKNQSSLYQSFYGWKIKTDKQVFDTSSMGLMNFKIPQNDSTQFIYVLTFESDTALVELTRFGKEKLTKEEADTILQDYVQQLGASFEILEVEVGVIPMNSGKIDVADYGDNWINMGARANLLKCSTGYAFHNMAEDAVLQTKALKNNQKPVRETKKSRFSFYDRLLLKILSNTPLQGKIVFETLFEKVPVIMVLKFLREKTTPSEEVFIFSKLPKKLFLTAALKDIYHQINQLPIIVLPLVFTAIAILLSFLQFEFIAWGILAVGFLSVGLAHGALDHLTSQKISSTKQLIYFVLSYLLKGALFGIVWWLSSDVALVLFILYSAWHFGQTDFKEWNLKQGWQSFLWGGSLLTVVLFFHLDELSNILKQIPNLTLVNLIHEIPPNGLLLIQVLAISSGLILALLNKSTNLVLTLIYLLLASQLSLLMAFGIYFVLQHSMNGWKHLSVGLDKDSSVMWKNALPFTIGGAGILVYFLLFTVESYIGIFFIILSCLSLPHVFSMHQFYQLTSSK
ncbi:beta-carotene 15,15'-dioxygenase, Brp/Blh family [Vicingaceae bacterium]|nr:beta-carotene 15,15'-dioxygenase, Brp/Blh family [Vicingaceae bacterium]MDB4082687.1 beta-carotene 15,15'-dioxygenase, Brp/Blh family [Vicingaceae bacterium]